ncbi:MAG TPA: hypothetical protein VFK68_05825, partial [Propionibacteriaceae bacterium]|nr:hypothetical protein [Propionibacteriaceae bacterium]
MSHDMTHSSAVESETHGDHGAHPGNEAHAGQASHDTRGGHDTQVGHDSHAAHAGHDAHAAHAGHDAHAAHAGHDAQTGHAGHAGHVQRFRRLFWVMLVLAVPVVALSPMFAMLVGYPVPTGAWLWVPPVLGTVLYAWGG